MKTSFVTSKHRWHFHTRADLSPHSVFCGPSGFFALRRLSDCCRKEWSVLEGCGGCKAPTPPGHGSREDNLVLRFKSMGKAEAESRHEELEGWLGRNFSGQDPLLTVLDLKKLTQDVLSLEDLAVEYLKRLEEVQEELASDRGRWPTPLLARRRLARESKPIWEEFLEEAAALELVSNGHPTARPRWASSV